MLVALVANTRLNDTEFHVEYDPPHTIDLVEHGIRAAGHDFVFIEASEDIIEALQTHEPDLVFNRAEGIRGESRESHVPAILEMLGIPYVGSNVLTTAVSLNKAWTKKVLSYHDIRTPNFVNCRDYREYKIQQRKLQFPVILKPNDEGSSMGIDLDNVVHNEEQLERRLDRMAVKYNQEILVEEFIEGREFSVGILGEDGDWRVFPILEIDFSRLPEEVGSVFGQYAKTLDAELDYCVIPAPLEDELRREIEETSKYIAKVLEVHDFARIDYRLDQQSRLYFLEINPLPGIDYDPPGDFSFYPLMATHAGLDFDELIALLLRSAARRYGLEV